MRLFPAPTRHGRAALALLACVTIAAPAALTAQGVGTTGAAVLELPAGSRATGMAGAYTAAAGDIDAIFYNPAGIATLKSAVGLSYQSYVANVTLGSAAAAFRVGHVVMGAALNYLDGGSIDVLVPDPAYGGQRGQLTGQTATAGETAIRFTVAGSLISPKFRIATSAGYVSSTIAGSGSNAAFFDLGAQYDVNSRITVGAGVRNFGGSLRGPAGTVQGPLPSEARIGVSGRLPLPDGLGAIADLDIAPRMQGSGTPLLCGVEFGLEPAKGRLLSAVGRIGYATTSGNGGLGGKLRLGAGIGVGPLSIDYTYQSFQYFGAVQRFGLRWTRF